MEQRRPQTPTNVASPQSDGAMAPPPTATAAGSAQHKASMPPLEITWSLSPIANGSALRLDYTVTNVGDELVYVMDQLVTMDGAGLKVLPNRAVVTQAAAADTVRLVAGHVGPGPGHAVAWEAFPPARTLAAKASLTGSKKIPLPLASWHPYMQLPALAKVPTRAVFEVTWLPKTAWGREPSWQDIPVSGGGTVRTPSASFAASSLRRATTPAITLP